MAYKKASKKSLKKMQMGGDYMEPNKELTFGGMKGKYQAGSVADPKRAPDYSPTTSSYSRTGRPMKMGGTQGTGQGREGKSGSTVQRVAPKPAPTKPASDENTVATSKLKAARRLQSGGLKDVPEGSKGKGLSNLPTAVRNKMGFKRYGGNK
jgi:hypothetical protein